MGNQYENGTPFRWTTVDNNYIDDENYLKGFEKWTFVTLLRHAFSIGEEARPSQQTLANKVGVSRKTMNEILQRLEEKGFLERRGIHKETQTVIWRVIVPPHIEYEWKKKDLELMEQAMAKGPQAPQQNFQVDKDPEPEPKPAAKEKKAAKPKKDDDNDDEIPFEDIVKYLNEKTGKAFRWKSHKTHIRARWNDGFRLEDFKKVVDIKTPKWIGEEKTNEWLRPRTLFGPKMEDYINEAPTKQQQKKQLFAEPKKKEEVSPIAELNGQFFDTRIPEEKAMYKHLLAIDMGLIDPQEPQQ